MTKEPTLASRQETIGKLPIPHDKDLHRQRHKIEHMNGRPKEWRRIATRDDSCARTFFSAIG